jgi:hypothetical protein
MLREVQNLNERFTLEIDSEPECYTSSSRQYTGTLTRKVPRFQRSNLGRFKTQQLAVICHRCNFKNSPQSNLNRETGRSAMQRAGRRPTGFHATFSSGLCYGMWPSSSFRSSSCQAPCLPPPSPGPPSSGYLYHESVTVAVAWPRRAVPVCPPECEVDKASGTCVPVTWTWD